MINASISAISKIVLAATDQTPANLQRLLSALGEMAADPGAPDALPIQIKRQILSIYAASLTRNDVELVIGLWLAITDLNDDILNIWLLANRHLLERLLLDARGNPEYLDEIRHRILKFNMSWTPLGEAGKPIFVSAIPKSGSTYYCHLLSAYTGKSVLSLHTSNRYREDLDTRMLTFAERCGAIMQGHNPAGDELALFLRTKHLQPIILLRNIFDCIVSYVPHIESGVHFRRYGFSFAGMSDCQKLDYAVRHLAPNHVHFVASWKKYADRFPALMLRYEDNTRNWREALRKSLVHANIEWHEPRGDHAVNATRAHAERNPGRLRKRTDRSPLKDFLNRDHLEYVRSFYAYYPDIDFSDIDD